MNDWWKMALGGAAGAGLLAATGGTAGLGLFGTGAAEAAAPAAAAGTAGGTLAGELGTGAISTGAGSTFGGMNAANALGATLAPEGGMLAAPTGAGMFVTPPVMGAAGPLDGALAGTSAGYGSPAALAQAGAMNTAPAPGLLAQAQGYADQAGKAASAYGTVSHAMGGQPPPQQAPQGRPIFQGDAAPIAPQGMGAPQGGMQQGMLAQPDGTAGGMLRNIAQQRLGRRF